ncbi:MAG: hypothetical protein ACJA0P_002550, partial [Planctomycetota bacterium]
FAAGFEFDRHAANAATLDEATLPQDVDRDIRPFANDEDTTLVVVEAMPPSADALVVVDVDVNERARAAVNRLESRVAVPLPDDTAPATATITGTVVDGEGGPIEGVTVVTRGRSGGSTIAIEGTESKDLGRAWEGLPTIDESLERSARSIIKRRRTLRTATSDAAGKFELLGVEAGRHSLQSYLEGYAFSYVVVEAGQSARIVGEPVGVFRLDVRMPDGSAAEKAVVLATTSAGAVPGYRQQKSLRWSLEVPEVRADSRTLTLSVLAGNVRRLRSVTYASDLASSEVTIDLERDGDGPHLVQLERRGTLRVTVAVAGAADGETPQTWVKVISAPKAAGSQLASILSRVPKLQAGADGVFEQSGLEVGSCLITVGRIGDKPEVSETITISEGVTDHRIVLVEIDHSKYVIARCIGPDGTPLPRVRFRGSVDNGQYPRLTYIGNGEPGEDGYMLLVESIRGDEPWVSTSKVKLTATAGSFGTLTLPLELGQETVEFNFQPTCSINVRVEGGAVAGLAVGATAIEDDEGDEKRLRLPQLSERPVDLDTDGHARLDGLQPGRYRISLGRGGRAGQRNPPIATAEVTLISGTQEVVMSAPVLYELAVHAQDLDVGTRLYLVKAELAETSASMLSGQNAALDAEHRSLFADVPAGDYVLSAITSGMQRMRVTVPSGEVEFVADVMNAFAINEVKPGKLGQRAGLKVGDIVVALDGEAVNGNNFHQKLAVAVEAAAVDLTVERGGTTVTISLGPIEPGSKAWTQIGVGWSPRSR